MPALRLPASMSKIPSAPFDHLPTVMDEVEK